MKTYCKENKVRFECKTNDGFIGSWLIPYRAGMERIKKIGKKRVYYQFICHPDGDIEFGRRIKTEFLKTKRL